MEEEDGIGLKWGNTRVIGVYGKGKSNMRTYVQWALKGVGEIRNKDRILNGDWNAGHPRWSEKRKEDRKGGSLEEAITRVGIRWKRMKGHTWERKVRKEIRTSRIDLIFDKGQVGTLGKIDSRKI